MALRFSVVLLVAGFALGFSLAADAAIVAYDPFVWSASGPPDAYGANSDGNNYSTSGGAGKIKGTDTTGQNPAIPGFSGRWAGTTTSLWQVKETGLTNLNPEIESAGGLVQFGYNDGGGHVRYMSRSLSSPPTVAAGDTYYMSGLVNAVSGAQRNDGHGWAGFADNSSDSSRGWKVGFQATGTDNNLNLVFQHLGTGGGAVTSLLQSNINPGETFFVLVRGTADGGTGTNDSVQVWVNPGYILSDADLGTPDYTNDDLSLSATNPFQYFVLQGENMGSGDDPRDVQFDEFRLTTTLYQAMGIIPEPAALLVWSLLAGLGMSLGWRRRR